MASTSTTAATSITNNSTSQPPTTTTDAATQSTLPRKTVGCALSGNDDLSVLNHATSITTPNDLILFFNVSKESDEYTSSSIKEAQSVFNTIQRACQQRNRHCEFRPLFYRPKGATTVRSNRAEVAQALCVASQMNQVDTLIVGFRSLSTLDKSIFGSVSEQTVVNCPVSVAVVKGVIAKK